LKEFGSDVKFNNKCRHKGYKMGSVKTYLSAQEIFSAPRGSRQQSQNNEADLDGQLKEDNISRLHQKWFYAPYYGA
jgi:hypothetical protein